MDKIEVTWLTTKVSSIAQIYSSGIEFSFLSDNMQQCHPFIFCKDFLQDVVQSFFHKKQTSIYGFSYDPNNHPALCIENTRLMVANSSDAEFGKKAESALDFINQICKAMRLKKTKLYEAANPPSKYKNGVYVYDGSGMWMNSPPLISMYSLLLRCGFTHPIGQDYKTTINNIINGSLSTIRHGDRNMLITAKNGIEKIINYGYRKFFYKETKRNYPNTIAVGNMHHSCGIVAFTQGLPKSLCPYWYRKSLTKLTGS